MILRHKKIVRLVKNIWKREIVSLAVENGVTKLACPLIMAQMLPTEKKTVYIALNLVIENGQVLWDLAIFSVRVIYYLIPPLEWSPRDRELGVVRR